MRKLRVIITGGAVPTLLATLLAPACGERSGLDVDVEASTDASVASPDTFDSALNFNPDTSMVAPDTSPGALCSGPSEQVASHVVSLPAPGTPADPAQICAVASPPVTSNVSARFMISDYSPQKETVTGFIAIDAGRFKLIVGPPKITVVEASDPTLATLQVVNMIKQPNNYILDLKWAGPLRGVRSLAGRGSSRLGRGHYQHLVLREPWGEHLRMGQLGHPLHRHRREGSEPNRQ